MFQKTSEKKHLYNNWWFYCSNLSGCHSVTQTLWPLASCKTTELKKYWRKMTDFQTLGKESYMRRISFSLRQGPKYVQNSKNNYIGDFRSLINFMAQPHFWNIAIISAESSGSYAKLKWTNHELITTSSFLWMDCRGVKGLFPVCGWRLQSTVLPFYVPESLPKRHLGWTPPSRSVPSL